MGRDHATRKDPCIISKDREFNGAKIRVRKCYSSARLGNIFGNKMGSRWPHGLLAIDNRHIKSHTPVRQTSIYYYWERWKDEIRKMKKISTSACWDKIIHHPRRVDLSGKFRLLDLHHCVSYVCLSIYFPPPFSISDIFIKWFKYFVKKKQ